MTWFWNIPNNGKNLVSRNDALKIEWKGLTLLGFRKVIHFCYVFLHVFITLLWQYFSTLCYFGYFQQFIGVWFYSILLMSIFLGRLEGVLGFNGTRFNLYESCDSLVVVNGLYGKAPHAKGGGGGRRDLIRKKKEYSPLIPCQKVWMVSKVNRKGFGPRSGGGGGVKTWYEEKKSTPPPFSQRGLTKKIHVAADHALGSLTSRFY